MKVTWKLIFILIMSTTILVACGDDEEAVSEQEEENTSEEVAVESPEESEINTEEGAEEGTEEESVLNEDEDTMPVVETEDQELEFGETGIFEDAFDGKFEITPHSIRVEEEIQGESAPSGKWFIIETTIENISEEAVEILPSPSLVYGDEEYTEDNPSFDIYFSDAYSDISNIEIDVNELQYYYEGNLEPGETVELEVLFTVSRPDSNYFQLVYGPSSKSLDLDYMNNVWWKIDPSEIE